VDGVGRYCDPRARDQLLFTFVAHMDSKPRKLEVCDISTPSDISQTQQLLSLAPDASPFEKTVRAHGSKAVDRTAPFNHW
jgi:hypothetical protein